MGSALSSTRYFTGSAPFGGSLSDHTRQQIIIGQFRPPRQVNPQVPPALDAVCRKAMAVDPSRRYGTARELADEVEAWLADEPVRAWREPWRVRAGRWMRRHRTITGAGMAAVFVATISLTVGTLLLAGERARACRQTSGGTPGTAGPEEFPDGPRCGRQVPHAHQRRPRLKARPGTLRRDLLETAQVSTNSSSGSDPTTWTCGRPRHGPITGWPRSPRKSARRAGRRVAASRARYLLPTGGCLPATAD